VRRLAVLGPPGRDPLAVAELIADRLGVPVLSVGGIVQAEFRAGSPASAVLRRYLDAAEVPPAEVLAPIVVAHLGGDGFVVHGLPNAAIPPALLPAPLDRVVELVLSDEEALRRLAGRRACRGCGRLWHTESDPPARPRRCDLCGAALFRRDDDHPASVAARLRDHRSAVAATLEHYRALGVLRRVDATPPVAEVVAAALR
jgi:adenylate kinase